MTSKVTPLCFGSERRADQGIVSPASQGAGVAPGEEQGHRQEAPELPLDDQPEPRHLTEQAERPPLPLPPGNELHRHDAEPADDPVHVDLLVWDIWGAVVLAMTLADGPRRTSVSSRSRGRADNWSGSRATPSH